MKTTWSGKCFTSRSSSPFRHMRHGSGNTAASASAVRRQKQTTNQYDGRPPAVVGGATSAKSAGLEMFVSAPPAGPDGGLQGAVEWLIARRSEICRSAKHLQKNHRTRRQIGQWLPAANWDQKLFIQDKRQRKQEGSSWWRWRHRIFLINIWLVDCDTASAVCGTPWK